MSTFLDEKTVELWEESLSPDMTSEDSIRSSNSRIQSKSLPSLRARALKGIGSESNQFVDFEIQEKLGAGGMGVVYTARQSSINRNVAIKMVKPEHVNSKSASDLLMSEAVVTGSLDHPNVVPVYDLGVDDNGQVFYAMKEVEGFLWSELIQKKTLDENLEILLRVADTIAFAHCKGLLHRDIKPQNVMLGTFGEVLVMDWGAACSLGTLNLVGLLPSETACCGTPAYMAPEMARGDDNRLGEATDVYLLGAILYQIISGHPPRSEKDPLICLAAAANNKIEPISQEGELAQIAFKAMAAAPADRFTSVFELQKAIRAYRSHSKSISLMERARSSLQQAVAEEDYAIFNRVVYRLQESLELWQENDDAQYVLNQALASYAQCALSKNDLDLAQSLLHKETPEHAVILSQVEASIAERESKKKRMHRLLMAARFLLILTFVIFAVGFFWIRAEREEAMVQRQEALIHKQLTSDKHREGLVNLISSYYGEMNYDALINTFWQLSDQYGMEDLDENTQIKIRVAAEMNPWRGYIDTGIETAMRIIPSRVQNEKWVVGKRDMKKIIIAPQPVYNTESTVSIHDYTFGKRQPAGRVSETIRFPVELRCGEAVCFQGDRFIWAGAESKIYRMDVRDGRWETVLDIANLRFDPLSPEYNFPEEKRSEFLDWMKEHARDLPVTGLEVTRDGLHAAVALGSGVVCWIDLTQKKCIGWFNINMACYLNPSASGKAPLLDLSPDETILSYREGEQSTYIFIFELENFSHMAHYYCKDYAIPVVEFACTNRFFAFSQDCILFSPGKDSFNSFGPIYQEKGHDFWDVVRYELQRKEFKNCLLASFLEDGTRFCAYLGDGSLFAASTIKGGYELRHTIMKRDFVDCAILESGWVTMLSDSGRVDVYDINTYAIRSVSAPREVMDLTTGSASDTFLVLTASDNRTNNIIEVASFPRNDDPLRLVRQVCRQDVSDIESALDGRYIAAGNSEGGVVLDIRSGVPVSFFDNLPNNSSDLTLDHVGEYLVSAGDWARGLKLFRTKDGTELFSSTNAYCMDVVFVSHSNHLDLVVAQPSPENQLVCYRLDRERINPPQKLWSSHTQGSPMGVVPFYSPSTGELKYWCKSWFQGFQLYDASSGKASITQNYWRQSGIGRPEYVQQDSRVAFPLENSGFEMALKSDLFPIFDPRRVPERVSNLTFSSDGAMLGMVYDEGLLIMNLTQDITETILPENMPKDTPTHYLSQQGWNMYPYKTLLTAAHTFKDVVEVVDDGGTILVDSGVYYMDRKIRPTKSYHLRSIHGPLATILDGGSDMVLFNYENLQGAVSLEGFTLRGGRGNYGGAIRIKDCSNVVISNCIVYDNRTMSDGGGVRVLATKECNVSLVDCVICDNTAPYGGGGGLCIYNAGGAGTVQVTRCTISGNEAMLDGGGISNTHVPSKGSDTLMLYIEQSSIVSNRSLHGQGGGIYASGATESCQIQDGVFLNNMASNVVEDTAGKMLINAHLHNVSTSD